MAPRPRFAFPPRLRLLRWCVRRLRRAFGCGTALVGTSWLVLWLLTSTNRYFSLPRKPRTKK
jgi:hypothetical protein